MKQPHTPQNPSRRRLAKGAAAVPAVLASISAKNALASPIYGCTVSGQMSGNASPGRDLNPDCEGMKVRDWTNRYSDRYSFRGAQSSNGVPAWLGITRQGGEVTRQDVFAKPSALKFAYNQDVTIKAFAVYCNAEAGNYHVSLDESRDLFQVAVSGGFYTKNNHKWDQETVIRYLTMLVG